MLGNKLFKSSDVANHLKRFTKQSSRVPNITQPKESVLDKLPPTNRPSLDSTGKEQAIDMLGRKINIKG